MPYQPGFESYYLEKYPNQSGFQGISETTVNVYPGRGNTTLYASYASRQEPRIKGGRIVGFASYGTDRTEAIYVGDALTDARVEEIVRKHLKFEAEDRFGKPLKDSAKPRRRSFSQ